ncbi:MAG TPA: 3-deoxy-8-phosphooctulonate synthase, partial [Proteobacteria bacterium]|nr:3-deoxy-8-phosphooctulonate synthase [Pseudomonadota bacterium]
MNPVTINSSIAIGTGRPLALIAGPCVIESEELALGTAETVAEICQSLDIPYIF